MTKICSSILSTLFSCDKDLQRLEASNDDALSSEQQLQNKDIKVISVDDVNCKERTSSCTSQEYTGSQSYDLKQETPRDSRPKLTNKCNMDIK